MTNNQVLKVITVTEELSLTAIAKKLGKAKANKEIKNIVASLVQEGLIVENSGTRYPTYSKKGKGVVKAKTATPVKAPSGDTKSSVVTSPLSATPPSIPEASERQISGFMVKALKEKGKDKVQITLPSGKRVKINDEDSLLVINDEPKFVVKTPTDVLSCVREYALKKGMRHFTVDDIVQNKKIGTSGDVQISDSHLMFLTIKKHNKAAA